MARILVAEDTEAVRSFVTRALQHEGHQVTGVGDGAQALEKLQADSYELLLTDIVMPVMDGIALALKVARDHPDVRILMMTGYAEAKRRAYNMESLIHDVISKPFTANEICDAVAKALAAGR
jgi:CheY-like chemotaxis protein